MLKTFRAAALVSVFAFTGLTLAACGGNGNNSAQNSYNNAKQGTENAYNGAKNESQKAYNGAKNGAKNAYSNAKNSMGKDNGDTQ